MKMTLKALRTNKDISQKDAADSLGVAQDTLSNWERGETFPNAFYIKKIEDFYGVQYEDINFLLPSNSD